VAFLTQLQVLRKARKITLAKVGQRIGMAPSNLATVLSGKHDVRASTLEAIAAALDAEWVLVPREHHVAVQRLVAGQGTGPDLDAKTSVELLREQLR
jgi:transcriptional regulator with XRE-family HTH domain